MSLTCSLIIAINHKQCDNCYDVNGGVTVLTGSEAPTVEVCLLNSVIEDYIGKTSDVEGVQSIQITNVHTNGISCVADDRGADFAAAETIFENEDKGIFHEMFWPVFVALVILLLLLLFVRRRRKQKHLREMADIEARAARYRAEFRDKKSDHVYPLNAIDVHQCHSLRCAACGTSDGTGTQFVNTDGAKLVRNTDVGWSMENKYSAVDRYPDEEYERKHVREGDYQTTEI